MSARTRRDGETRGPCAREAADRLQGPKIAFVGMLLVLNCAITLAQASRPAAEPSPTPSPAADQARLQALRALAATEASAPRGSEWFPYAVQRREALIEAATTYTRLYPGCQNLPEVIRLELRARFERAALTGGDLRPLQDRIDALSGLLLTADAAAAAELAFWRMQCMLHRPESSAARGQTLTTHDELRRARIAEFVTAHPDSPHVPQLLFAEFEDAVSQDDRAAAAALATDLVRATPEHPFAQFAAGLLRRIHSTDAPVRWPPTAEFDQRWDWPAAPTNPVLILVYSVPIRDLDVLRHRLAALRTQFPALQLIAIRADILPADPLTPPLIPGATHRFHAKHVAADPFLRHWGLFQLPRALIFDERQVLRYAGDLDDIRPLIAALNPPTATDVRGREPR